MRRFLSAFSTERKDIFEPTRIATMRSDGFKELVFPSESAKDRVRWKGLIFSGLAPHLALNWESSQLSREPDVLLEEDFIARFRLQQVRSVPGFN